MIFITLHIKSSFRMHSNTSLIIIFFYVLCSFYMWFTIDLLILLCLFRYLSRVSYGNRTREYISVTNSRIRFNWRHTTLYSMLQDLCIYDSSISMEYYYFFSFPSKQKVHLFIQSHTHTYNLIDFHLASLLC